MSFRSVAESNDCSNSASGFMFSSMLPENSNISEAQTEVNGLENSSSNVRSNSVDSIACRICEKHVLRVDLSNHSTLCLRKHQELLSLEKINKKLAKYLVYLSDILSVLILPEQGYTYNLVTRLLEVANLAFDLNIDCHLSRLSELSKCCSDILIFIEKFSHRFGVEFLTTLKEVQDLMNIKCSSVSFIIDSLQTLALSLNISDFRSNCILTPGVFSSYDSPLRDDNSGTRSRSSPVIETPTSGSDNSPRNSPVSSFLQSRQKYNRVSIDDFIVIKPISRGGQGSVFLCQKRTTKDIFALKVLKKKVLILRKNLGFAQEEQDILLHANNQWVVRLYYTFHSQGNIYLVLEYHPGGDCFALLRQVGFLSGNHAKSYLADIVLALEYLHSIGIVHRDVKPDNFLISKSGHLKLTDFGLSAMYGTIAQHIVKFSHVFDNIIGLLHDLALVKELVRLLMEKHASYNVLSTHVGHFKVAFLDILSSKLEHRFNGTVKLAWEWFLDSVIITEIYSATELRSGIQDFGKNDIPNPDEKYYVELIKESWEIFKTSFSVTYAAKLVFLRLYNEHYSIACLFRNRKVDYEIDSKNSFGSFLSALKIDDNIYHSDHFHNNSNCESIDNVVGSAEYISPEMLQDSLSGSGPFADIWSFGVIMYEFLCGVTPFTDDTQIKVYDNILRCNINWNTLNEHQGNAEAIDLLRHILVAEPHSRYTIEMIKKHPYFNGINWTEHYSTDTLFVPELENETDTSYFDPRDKYYPTKNISLPGAKVLKVTSFQSPYKPFIVRDKSNETILRSPGPDIDRFKIAAPCAEMYKKSTLADLIPSIEITKTSISPHYSPATRLKPQYRTVSPLMQKELTARLIDRKSRVFERLTPVGSPMKLTASPRRSLATSHISERSFSKKLNENNSKKSKSFDFIGSLSQYLIWNPEFETDVCPAFWEFLNSTVKLDDIVIKSVRNSAPRSFEDFNLVCYQSLYELNMEILKR